jgi:lipopolysaccharide exporter
MAVSLFKACNGKTKQLPIRDRHNEAVVRRAAAQGVRWTGTAELVTSGLQFVQTAVLARLLAPEDFGLMAMVLAVLGLAQVYTDMGVSNALIYRQDTAREHLSSLYWLNIFAGLAAFGVLALLAPAIAAAFGEPRLQPLLLLAASVFLIVPMGQQFQVLMQKHFRFRALAAIEMAAAAAGAAVAVGIAFGGHGVYALVWGYMALAGVKALLLTGMGWREWRPALRFVPADLRGYLGFGLYQMGERTINYLTSRWGHLIIGGMLGAEMLGFYHLAHLLVIQPVTRLVPVMTRVAFPVFARMQADTSALKSGFLFMLRGLTSVSFPALLGLAAVAPWLVPVIFGSEWLPAVPLIQILSLTGLLRSAATPANVLLLARGRADLAFKWRAAVVAVYVPALAAGAHLGEVLGVVWAMLAVQLAAWLASYRFLVRGQLGPCLGAYLRSMAPALWLSCLMALAVLAFTRIGQEPSVIMLGLVIGTGGALYACLYYFLQREQFLEFRNFMFHPQTGGSGLS